MPNKVRLDKKIHSQTVRITDELNNRLDRAVASMKLGAKQEVIRLAIDIGLLHLENVKYDVAKCVLMKSEKFQHLKK